MSEGRGLDRGHTGYRIHVADRNDTAEDMMPIGVVQNPRKLEVECHDEIYYPVVSILRNETAEEIEVSMNTPKTEYYNELRNELQNESQYEPEKTVVNDVAVTMSKPKRQSKRWQSRLGTALVAVAAIMAIVLVGLRLAGFRTFTVMSGSMDPEYPVGALIYVKPTDYHSLQVGDVISYVANDDKTVVTHRIVEIEVDRNDPNVWRFRTKGDANSTSDSNLVHYKNVLGSPAITIPFIGYVAHNIQQPPGIYITLVAGTLLLAWTFLPGTLEERRKTARKSVA